ncbi:MAG TPA: hypothetical protein VG847_05555 [Chitinophagaceae bacterium]|nr:hypothetical protein [Chitinophagaceae bacterium]
MAQHHKHSKHSGHHPEHPPVPQSKINARKYRVITVAVIFFLLFGTGIAFFASGGNIIWLITGAIIGGFLGFFFGKQIVKGLFKE